MISKDLYKRLGRHLIKDNYDYFSFSGSGIEFYIKNNNKDITICFELESIITEDKEQFVKVFIDDNLLDKYRLGMGNGILQVHYSSNNQYSKITFIKINESEISNIKLFNIFVDGGEIIKKEFDNKPKIEFYGDSLTCGYGNLALSNQEGYKTSTQDVTLAYAYLTAKELGYEFSCVARSGISMALPIYYPKIYKEIFNTVDCNIKYEVDYKVDIAVINLISNDNGFLRQSKEIVNDMYDKFYNNYLEIAEEIIRRNKDVKLLFCYKLIDTENEKLIEQLYLVKDYIKNKYNKEVPIVKFNPNHDGASYHPSVKAHQENSLILINQIKEMLKKE